MDKKESEDTDSNEIARIVSSSFRNLSNPIKEYSIKKEDEDPTNQPKFLSEDRKDKIGVFLR
jgi:hypothetical protein